MWLLLSIPQKHGNWHKTGWTSFKRHNPQRVKVITVNNSPHSSHHHLLYCQYRRRVAFGSSPEIKHGK